MRATYALPVPGSRQLALAGAIDPVEATTADIAWDGERA